MSVTKLTPCVTVCEEKVNGVPFVVENESETFGEGVIFVWAETIF